MKSKITRSHFLTTYFLAVLIALVLVSVPSGAGAAPNGSSHTATSKDWTVTLWVARTSARAGASIPAIVTVDNRSGRNVDIFGCPGTDYEVVAGNSAVPNSPAIPTVACGGKMSPGVHVFRTKVFTVYMGCGGGGNPPCGQPPKLSPLPNGTYHTQLILPSSKPSLPMPRPLIITLTGKAPRVRIPNCREQQMTETVHSVPMKPTNSLIVWYGQVKYKNTGAECEMVRSTVMVQAQIGGAASQRTLSMKNSPVSEGGSFPVQHNGVAHAWLEVSNVPHRNWQPGYCPPVTVSGLNVGGPSSAWPLNYFALSPEVSICSDITVKVVSGMLEPGLLITSPGLDVATPSKSSCEADLNRASTDIAMPSPRRLGTTRQLFGYSFTPVEDQFVPRASARDAWRDFDGTKQSTATYEVFLARFHPDNPVGTNTRLKVQNVWVAFAKHVAFVPEPGPPPNSVRPSCTFGSSMTVVNANTGMAIVSAGG